MPDVAVSVEWLLSSGTAPVSDARAADLLRYALAQEGRTGTWVLAIRFTDDAGMTRLHETYMGVPSPTDILTFPYDDDQGGDIVISVETASRNAADAGWSTAGELDFLMLHGVLHILGWNDHDDADRAAMLDRQSVLLSGWQQSQPE